MSHQSPVQKPPDWMLPAGGIVIAVAIVGFVASGATGGGPSREGAMTAGALNPLFFIGLPLGLCWLYGTGFFGSSKPAQPAARSHPWTFLRVPVIIKLAY